MTTVIDNTLKEADKQVNAAVVTQEEEKKQLVPEEPKATEEQTEDPNWRAFREARKKDRAEKEAAERKAADKEAEVNALKAAMEAAFARDSRNGHSNAKHVEPNYYEESETEDERIEKKVQAALSAREAAYENARIEREKQEYPRRLAQTYADYNDVVNSDHIDYLEYHYPEVAAPLKRLPDGYDKWSDVYKALKKFVPNINHRKEAARAEANFNKPKSLSSAGAAPIQETGNSIRLTEDRRAANWERMQKQLKGVS